MSQIEKIIVNYDSLLDIGNNILSYADKFDYEVTKLKNLINDIDKNWIGTDMQAFIETMNSNYFPCFDNLKLIIEKCGNLVVEYKNKYEYLDNRFGNE